MSELANYFCQKSKYQVHIILFGSKREIFYRVPFNLIIHKPEFRFNRNLRIWHTVKTIYFLRKKVKSIDPSSILSFGEIWNNLVLISLLGLKYNLFISDRCSPSKRWSKKQEILRKLLYKNASGIICQTEIAKEIYKCKFLNPNIQVIGNPIRLVTPDPKIKKENIILSIGRLIDSKQHDQLIKIFSAINPINWKLIIVGDNALNQSVKSRLESLINMLGMSSKILLVGEQKNVDFYYNQAKIFAFTSRSEGFPNVIGEAMTAGLPVIAYDCIAGPSFLIEDGFNGYLVKLNDTDTYIEKLKSLLDDELLRDGMGENGKMKIESFNIEKIGLLYEELLFLNQDKV